MSAVGLYESACPRCHLSVDAAPWAAVAVCGCGLQWKVAVPEAHATVEHPAAPIIATRLVA